MSEDNILYDMARKTIRDVHASITELAVAPRISESRFRDIFLPFFANIGNPYNVDINLWISAVAVSPFNEVIVYDDNTGTDLFKVPAIQDKEVLDLKNGNNTLAGAIDAATKISTVSPHDGNAYLQQQMSQYIGTKGIGAAFLKNVDRWNDIMARYDLPIFNKEIESIATVSDAVTTASTPSSVPVVGYEEF